MPLIISAKFDARNLFEQLDENDRNTVALLLGFADYKDDDAAAAGFRGNLRTMKVIEGRWTYFDLVKAYCEHVIRSIQRQPRAGEIIEG